MDPGEPPGDPTFPTGGQGDFSDGPELAKGHVSVACVTEQRVRRTFAHGQVPDPPGTNAHIQNYLVRETPSRFNSLLTMPWYVADHEPVMGQSITRGVCGRCKGCTRSVTKEKTPQAQGRLYWVSLVGRAELIPAASWVRPLGVIRRGVIRSDSGGAPFRSTPMFMCDICCPCEEETTPRPRPNTRCV